MQRNLRDTWAWRGALGPHELNYEPELGDAIAGPITEAAQSGWPLLVTDLDVAALVLRRDDVGPREALGPVGLFLLLFERSGGYHAYVPEADAAVAAAFADVHAGDDGVPGGRESLQLLIDAGLVERSRGRLGLARPPSPTLAELDGARRAMDRYALDAPADSIVARVGRLAWRTGAGGLGAERYRELARLGRLEATIAAADSAFPDPDGLLRVGPASLPALPDELVHSRGALGAARAWISTERLQLEDDGVDSELLTAGHEVGALLLGGGIGPTALRRAVRAAALWLLLAEQTEGRAGRVETTVAGLTAPLARLVGLATAGDHRNLVAQLLDDLERAGAVKLSRPTPRLLAIDLIRPPAPAPAALRNFVAEWALGRVALERSATPGDDPLAGAVRLADEHLHRRVRVPWVRFMEAGRMTVRVLPGPDDEGGWAR